MKKILVGILVLIPVIILMIVTLVSGIASVAAHIGVESIAIKLNEEGIIEEGITLELSDVSEKEIDLYDYLQVEVLPTRATNKTVEWAIADLQILDQEYKSSYEYYLEHKDEEDVTLVKPAVVLIDENGNEVETNTTGKLKINTYCTFTLKAMAENQHDQTTISVVGYDIEKLMLATKKTSIYVGDSLIVETNFTPIDSIVNKIEWSSSDETIATVNNNGIVKALKQGKVAITCRAYKYTNENEYIESTFNLVIEKAASLFGNVIYASSNSIELVDIGVNTFKSIQGGVVTNGVLSLDSDVVTIETANGLVVINKCEEDEIKINEKDVLDRSNGYIIAVSNLQIDLSCNYVSSFRDNGNLTGVVWTSSDENIATISQDGKLTTLASGLVTITATLNGKSATLDLNIQNKIASMQLITGDNFFKVGIAKETVFASMKYVDVNANNNKEANSISLRIKGEPKDASIDEIRGFYDAYDFEIKEGMEFAHFDSVDTNKLVFDDELEGQGKQTILIKVSAKYPRYSAFESYTTTELNINAIYGVQVKTYEELTQATLDQKTYAYQDGNLILTKGNDQVCTVETEIAKVSSQKTLAISLMSSIAYPENKNLDAQTKYLYGSLYGNNHMISSTSKIVNSNTAAIFDIVWSDVTLSNVIIRVNEITDDGIISADDASHYNGHCLTTGSNDNDKYRLLNINVEYSILENARCSCQSEACDISFKGCIVRNMSNVGMYIVYKIREGKYILPTNLTVENMIFSNCLGTAFDIDTFCFEVNDKQRTKYWFGETKEESDKYIRENIVANGLNGSFTQKGFLDIYNWQSTEDITLVKTGEEKLDDILKLATSSILGTDSSLEKYRYRYKGVDYFHLGFMVESMTPEDLTLSGAKTINETVWLDINLEDTRFNKFSIGDIQDEALGTVLKQFGMSIYSYKNDADLKPSSTYVINDKLIEKLHGNN